MKALPLVLLMQIVAAAAAPAETVVTSSRLDFRLRQVDVPTQQILAETTVTLDGAIVHGVATLASEPGTGTLFGVLREARCPGDPGRTVLARGSCNEFTPNATTCGQAFAINDGVPVSCVHTGASCAPCLEVNEGPLACTNTCLGTPSCASPGLEFAGNGGCSLFNGDPSTCVQKFALSGCGPAPCYVPPSTTGCTVCTPVAIASGQCTASCGALESRDPVHLVAIDMASGVATSRGQLGDDVTGLAFTCDGALSGVTGDARCRSDKAELLTIDPATAAITPGLAFEDGGGAALAFDPAEGVLLRASGAAGEVALLAIDPATSGVTVRPLSGPATADAPAAIVWEASTGALLWSHPGVSGDLFRVPDDGVSVALGPVGRRVDGMAFAGPGACAVCGDGAVEGAEGCDDGNVAAGDCCSAACALDAAGAACTADDDPCTDDACDASGACLHTALAGLAGADCLLGRLVDPNVCSPDPLDAKLGRALRKRGRKARALVGKAVANPAKAAKKLRTAGRQVAAIERGLGKRRSAVTPACASRLDGILEQLGIGLGEAGRDIAPPRPDL